MLKISNHLVINNFILITNYLLFINLGITKYKKIKLLVLVRRDKILFLPHLPPGSYLGDNLSLPPFFSNTIGCGYGLQTATHIIEESTHQQDDMKELHRTTVHSAH